MGKVVRTELSSIQKDFEEWKKSAKSKKGRALKAMSRYAVFVGGASPRLD